MNADSDMSINQAYTCAPFTVMPGEGTKILPNGSYLGSPVTVKGGVQVAVLLRVNSQGVGRGYCESGSCSWGGALSGGFAFLDGDEWKAIRHDTNPELFDEVHGDGSFPKTDVSFDPTGGGTADDNPDGNSQVVMSFVVTAACPGATTLSASFEIPSGTTTVNVEFTCSCVVVDGGPA